MSPARQLHVVCLAVLLALGAWHTGCRIFSSPTAAKVLDCGSEAVRQHAVRYFARVNGVITDGGSSEDDARRGLLSLVAEAGQDVIGCILRDQGAKFAESSRANPDDAVSARASRRADAFIAEQGWTFRD